MSGWPPLDVQITVALIGAALAVGGWFVNSAHDRRAARAVRRGRVRDVETAIVAEILPYLDALELFDLAADLEDVVDRMRKDAKFIPLVPLERNDTVFRAILPEIHVLPEAVIRPVVRYYSQLFAIEAMIDDLRADVFRTIAVARREAIYADFISMKLAALDMGKSAVAAIEADLVQDNG